MIQLWQTKCVCIVCHKWQKSAANIFGICGCSVCVVCGNIKMGKKRRPSFQQICSLVTTFDGRHSRKQKGSSFHALYVVLPVDGS